MNEKKPTKKDINLIKLNSTATRVVYWMFEVLIAVTLAYSIVMAVLDRDSSVALSQHISHIMLCAVALILYNIPSFVQKKFRVYVPSTIHIFVLLFIFAHFILGEVLGTYKVSAVFDKVLHTTSGMAIALGGFSLVNILNNSNNTHSKLSPLFVAMFSFCFALAIALLWEILEFASDSLFGTNMQRYLPPDNVKQASPPKQGYGLIDTMGDVIVSTVAAFVVSVLGYVALRKKAKALNRFLLRKIPDYDTAIREAEEAGDVKLVEALHKARAAALEQAAQEARDATYPYLDKQAVAPAQTAESDEPSENAQPTQEAEASAPIPAQDASEEEQEVAPQSDRAAEQEPEEEE